MSLLDRIRQRQGLERPAPEIPAAAVGAFPGAQSGPDRARTPVPLPEWRRRSAEQAVKHGPYAAVKEIA